MPLFALTACSDDDDDDNDTNGDKTEQTTNNGTKVLSKKVTKIVVTVDDGEEEYTYNFDEDGKIISSKYVEYDNGDTDTDIYTFSYSKDQIVCNSSYKTTTYNLENGRVVESIYERKDYDKTSKYTYSYSSDGYLESLNYVENCEYESDENIGEAKYTVTDGNYTKYQESESNYEWFEEYTISYNSKLNNLNVDLADVLIGLYYPTEFFGKRSKNLPISINWKYKYRSYIDRDGNPQYRVNNETTIFTYTYDGDYPVKVLEEWTETSDGGSSDSGTRTYEIFYE